jgi:hypothetical protein
MNIKNSLHQKWRDHYLNFVQASGTMGIAFLIDYANIKLSL